MQVLIHLDEEYYYTVLSIGLVIMVVGLLREFLSLKFPASDILLASTVGIILGPSIANAINPFDWNGTYLETEMGDIDRHFPIVYKYVTELMRIVLAVQLVAFALSVPWDYIAKAWKAQSVLLTLIMVFMWLASSVVVFIAFKIPFNGARELNFWESLLIGKQ
eukprot:TRINITY_DN16850_c0_g1_i1.p1 TRINITY_DN16850_c0_g1~~TRINITY_DN16850_c0_g1_i1.p1  ORF type:complete len:163 (+),score=12.02 TRINITY_DN16850_c0_g1_i1:404-892(+)